MEYSELIKKNLKLHKVDEDHPVVSYLEKKTSASKENSKARRSLGNLYALYVVSEDFNLGKRKGSSFSSLLERMKKKPFGEKLQNHPLDNRLNDEFRRRTGLEDKYMPITNDLIDGKKTRKISEDLLTFNASNPKSVSKFITSVIDDYINEITINQDKFLEKIENCSNEEELSMLFEECVDEKSDARLFEIFSYCVLYPFYKKKSASLSVDNKSFYEGALNLYRAGRTNANDGGIDFILQPTGKIFQVTETFDFKKYFLDFEKLNRYPITFVIKFEGTEEEAMKIIKSSASKFSEEQQKIYLPLFEEIITSVTLRNIFKELIKNEKEILQIKENLIGAYKLEFGIYS